MTAAANTVLSSAVPSEPPICCELFSTALATPASWCPTPISAVLAAGMNTPARPTLISSWDGSTCVAYDVFVTDLGEQQHADDRHDQAGDHQRSRADPRQQLRHDAGARR